MTSLSSSMPAEDCGRSARRNVELSEHDDKGNVLQFEAWKPTRGVNVEISQIRIAISVRMGPSRSICHKCGVGFQCVAICGGFSGEVG